MNISKLTITPISKGLSPFVQYCPTNETASLLIKERLVSGYTEKVPRALKKLPSYLKGLVNPDTKVIRRNNIDSFI